MKKIIAIISGLMLAGVVNAQGTVELTSAQMDRVTAGFAAAGAAEAGAVAAVGLFNLGASAGFAGTATIDVPGFTQATAVANNTSAAFSILGANASSSAATAAALVVD